MLQRARLSRTVVGGLLLAGTMSCGSDSKGLKNTPDADPSSGAGSGGSTGSGGAVGAGGAMNAGRGGSGSGGSGSGGAVVGAGGSTGAGGNTGSGGSDGGRPAGTDGGSADRAASSGDGASAAVGVMSFFVTSKGAGNGGNLGGLKGADKVCEELAQGVMAKKAKWAAYLSATGVNAKDRIGKGPWYNQKGQVFAESLEKLHTTVSPMMRAAYIAAKPADELFLDEKGAKIPGNQHDILTGSKADGTLAAATCEDWTSADAGKKAAVGHSDTPGNVMFSPSWNAAHESSGCTPMALVSTGGNGRIYCFATD